MTAFHFVGGQLSWRVALPVFAGVVGTTAVVLALVGMPVSRDFNRQAENDVLARLERRVGAIDILLQDSSRIAREYCHLDYSLEAGMVLGEWWNVPAAGDENFLVPEVARVDLSRVRGMIRHDELGGATLGSDWRRYAEGASPAGDPGGASVQNLYYVDDECLVTVLVACPMGRLGSGPNLVFVEAGTVERALLQREEFGASARLWLVTNDGESVRFLAPLAQGGGDFYARYPIEAVRQAIHMSRRSTRNPWVFVDSPHGRLAVVEIALPGVDWGLVLTVDSQEIYRRAWLKVILVFAVALILAAAAALLSCMALTSH